MPLTSMLLLLTAATPIAPPPPDALQIIACARTVVASAGKTIWPELAAAPFAVDLVDGERELVLCPPAGVEGLAPAGLDPASGCEMATRDRVLPPGLQATFPALGVAEPVVVIGTPAATGLTPGRYLLTIVHEHVHQLQMSQPGYSDGALALGLAGDDSTGRWMLEWPFPYADAEVGSRFAVLSKALAAALEQPQAASARRPAVAALAALREVLPEPARRYLGLQLWQEGVPRAIEVLAAERLAEAAPPCMEATASPSELAAELRREIAEQLLRADLAGRGRQSFYAVGAAIALLRAVDDPQWTGSLLQRPFELDLD